MTSWTVLFTHKTEKQSLKLPEIVRTTLLALKRDIELSGPFQPKWPHFGKLRGVDNQYHCHLKRGRPTFVACWKVTDKAHKLVEVYYVGSHENAPY